MDVRQQTALPTVAVVLVIDASGSMEAFGNELAKEELAKEIASSVIDLLGEHDQIAVITFDENYHWLVPPTEARNRDRVLDQVSRLQAAGGDAMYPAMDAGYGFLKKSRAKIRHMIVLSDFLVDPGDYQTAATTMAQQKITTSTVAIGDDADLKFARNLARWGLGRSYVAKDLYAIPQIFATEATVATRSYMVEEPTPLTRTGAGPTLQDLPTPPPIAGYVATVAKPSADVALMGPRRDPVLAAWHYGLGRSVAFMSDDGTRWTTAWASWPGAARFWSQAVRWTLRRPGDGLFLSLSHDWGTAAGRIVVDARRPDGTLWNGLAVHAAVDGPAGPSALDLEQTAPGRYEGTWSASVPGTYMVTVVARDAAGAVGTGAAGLAVPYSAELRMPGGNTALLAQLTEASGGVLLHRPEDAFRPGRGQGQRDGWPPLAGLAGALLVTEVAIRRVPALAQRMGDAWAAVAGVVRGRGADPARQAEDAAYAAADRWAIDDAKFAEEEKLRAASMDHAARIYIARLRDGTPRR
jgi:hypothetical protein